MKRLMTICGILCGCWACAWGQSLQVVVDRAVENNGTLQSAELDMKMTQLAVDEAWKLPDMKVSYGWFASEPQTRTGSQEYKVSVQQMFPWFGTITKQKNLAKAQVKLSHAEVLVAKRRLVLAVSRGYYQLFGLQQKIKVTNRYIKWLEEKRDLVLNKLKTNTGRMSDIFRIDMKINDLKQMVVEVEAKEASIQASMRSLMNESDMATIVTDSLVLNLLESSKDEKYGTQMDVHEHPMLKQVDAMMRVVDGQVKVNKSSRYPNIGVGMDYINVGRRMDMDVPGNGDDIYMLMVSLSVPLWNKAGTKAKKLGIKSRKLRVDRRQKILDLEAELMGAVFRRRAAVEVFTLQDKNRLTAHRAAKLALTNIANASGGVEQWLDWLRLEQQAEWKMIEAVTDYYMESAVVLYLVE